MFVATFNRFQEICRDHGIIRKILTYSVPLWKDTLPTRHNAARYLLLVFGKRIPLLPSTNSPFIEDIIQKIIPNKIKKENKRKVLFPYLTVYATGYKTYGFKRVHDKFLTDKKLREKILMKNYSRLDSINLSNTKITDVTLRFLVEYFPEIKSISLASTKITDEGLRLLAKGCSGIHTIHLMKTKITDKGLQYLTNGCSRIKKINLNHTKITNKGIGFLAKKCSQICNISLASTKITDNGLCLLAGGCSHIKVITLWDTNITKGFAKTLWPYTVDIWENGGILTYPPNETLEA